MAEYLFPCIGGPLHGEYAAINDFRKAYSYPLLDGTTHHILPGVYGEHADNYAPFNMGSLGRAYHLDRKTYPKMIWVYIPDIKDKPKRTRAWFQNKH